MSLAFNRTYRYLQRQAHEQPVLFWSVVLGSIGPVMAFAVPRIRENYFGYTRPENVPASFPLPNRSRRPTEGYED